MPFITGGQSGKVLDANALSLDRIRRNFQKMTQKGAVNNLIILGPGLIFGPDGELEVSVDGITIGFNPVGQLEELHPIVINETPGGTINGSNAAFTLSNPPVDGSLLVFVDGLDMVEGNDYTVAGSTFTFITGAIPQTGDSIRVTYRT